MRITPQGGRPKRGSDKTSRGGPKMGDPRQVPRLPPFKHTTAWH